MMPEIPKVLMLIGIETDSVNADRVGNSAAKVDRSLNLLVQIRFWRLRFAEEL